MNTMTIVLLVVTIVMVAAFVGLYFLGKRAEKQKAEQDEQAALMAQTVSMLIIDKKKMKLKESGLPEAVITQTPWYAKNAKLPIVKAKVGPKIMSLICDAEIFDDIPVKKEVKAVISGLYITSVKGLHGKTDADAPKKKGIRAWASAKYKELQSESGKSSRDTGKNKKKK